MQKLHYLLLFFHWLPNCPDTNIVSYYAHFGHVIDLILCFLVFIYYASLVPIKQDATFVSGQHPSFSQKDRLGQGQTPVKIRQYFVLFAIRTYC
jgi:hypothetical protein